MGRIKDIFKNKDITEKLIAMGFDYGRGPQGEIGYIRTFRDGDCYLWVTVSFRDNKLYLYNEFDCGGLLWKRDCDISKDVLDDCDKFIDWLDEEVG